MKYIIIFFVLVLSFAINGLSFAQDAESGKVVSIVKAPITGDGNVAGASTDFVVNFDVSFHPSVPGYTLMEGNSVSITLPEGFTYSGELPIAGVGSGETCTPANLQCTTGVFVQGWPQRPIGPPAATYEFAYDESTNTISYTALTDMIPNPPEAPGIKQAHMILRSFTNPEAGEYLFEVTTEFGEDGTAVTTTVPVQIFEEPAPNINHVSVFNEGTPNTVYQSTSTGEITPFAFDFLLFSSNNGAMNNVTVTHVTSNHALLMQAEWVVGHVYIDAPDGASGYKVITEQPSAMMNAPILGREASRLTVRFQAGDTAGDYMITFAMVDGNAIHHFVTVE